MSNDPYVSLTFNDGDILYAEQLNHMNEGIQANNNGLDDLSQVVNDISEDVEETKSRLTLYDDENQDGNIVISYAADDQ